MTSQMILNIPLYIQEEVVLRGQEKMETNPLHKVTKRLNVNYNVSGRNLCVPPTGSTRSCKLNLLNGGNSAILQWYGPH